MSDDFKEMYRKLYKKYGENYYKGIEEKDELVDLQYYSVLKDNEKIRQATIQMFIAYGIALLLFILSFWFKDLWGIGILALILGVQEYADLRVDRLDKRVEQARLVDIIKTRPELYKIFKNNVLESI